ncbi:unnamed protein product [Adineta steineri]|uniref:Uncharacterized protein n=1 Tax=Adineta steineri TaxID=433720 RepID=A0A816E0S7_9BILA|nr:unnamed protein product [Adineta steineri]CAF1639859.1 unnamed protein product [Adineta steineri]
MTANDEQTSVPTTSSIRIEWIWQSNPDPSSKSQPDEWSYYSDVENLIIEEAFLAKQTHVMLDDCCIDFEHGVRISNYDANKQKPLKRVVCKREDKHLREEHFMPDPIAPKRPFGGEYGWVSPFILEVRKDLNLESTQRLPSRDETIIPMIVEKAALESDKRQLSYTKNSTTTNHISGYTLSTYDDVISNCRDHSGLRIDLHYDGLDGFDLLRRRLGDDSLSFLHNDLLGHLGLPDITGLDRAPDYNDALHYDRDGNYHP